MQSDATRELAHLGYGALWGDGGGGMQNLKINPMQSARAAGGGLSKKFEN
jgi:hypothetical protein